MRDLAQFCQYTGFLLYSVPIFWFAFSLLRASTEEKSLERLRNFRSLGPLLGLSFGACIFGTLAGIWLDHGEFTLRWSTQTDRAESALHITFFAVWISNIKLEIWTLDPLRKLDSSPTVTPVIDDPLRTAMHATRRHIALHTVGLLAVLILLAGL